QAPFELVHFRVGVVAAQPRLRTYLVQRHQRLELAGTVVLGHGIGGLALVLGVHAEVADQLLQKLRHEHVAVFIGPGRRAHGGDTERGGGSDQYGTTFHRWWFLDLGRFGAAASETSTGLSYTTDRRRAETRRRRSGWGWRASSWGRWRCPPPPDCACGGAASVRRLPSRHRPAPCAACPAHGIRSGAIRGNGSTPPATAPAAFPGYPGRTAPPSCRSRPRPGNR